MFGTIAHMHPKSGHEAEVRALADDWNERMRPLVPGHVLSLSGRAKDRPGDIVLVALMQDEPTYRALAAMPEQDAWFRRMAEHLDREPEWEDVEMEIDIQD